MILGRGSLANNFCSVAADIDEVREKVRRLKLPKGQSVRIGLIYCGELDAEIDGRDDFDFLVPAEKLLKFK